MFTCSKCGECCRHIGGIQIFDELNRGDGICKFLEGNLCSIYKNRPIYCRVDEGYSIFSENMPKEEYYKINRKYCKKLQLMRRS